MIDLVYRLSGVETCISGQTSFLYIRGLAPYGILGNGYY